MSKDRNPFSLEDYDLICQEAASDQGLDPITDRLDAAGIPWVLEQTGGFCMAIGIYREPKDNAYLWITSESIYGGDPDTWAIGEYGWDDSEQAECEGRALDSHDWATYRGHEVEPALEAIRRWRAGVVG